MEQIITFGSESLILETYPELYFSIEPVDKIHVEPVDKIHVEPVDEPIAEPVNEPIAEPVNEPIAEPVDKIHVAEPIDHVARTKKTSWCILS